MNADAGGRERHAVPMAELTTWRCGGAADTVYAPAGPEERARTWRGCRRRCRWCGSGAAATCWRATAACAAW